MQKAPIARQVVLDTETTGINPKEGHRIIEIGCVELINRRLTHNRFHVYINPEREIDAGAIEVHGITNERVANEPLHQNIHFRATATDHIAPAKYPIAALAVFASAPSTNT